MGASIRISSELITEAMQSDATRAGLAERAGRVQSRVTALAQTEGVRIEPARVESGTRPKGRPYSRVVIDDGAEQEYGSSRMERRRILGRAAEGS